MPRLFSSRAATTTNFDPTVNSPSTFTDGLPLPKVLVFDLDYTLWPFWVDTHVTPPVKANGNNTGATDRTGDNYTFYQDIPSILYTAYSLQIPLALASRTHAPELALKMLSLIHVPTPTTQNTAHPKAPKKVIDFFQYRQIYPGDKKTHMRQIKKEGSIEFEDMLFFDDETRNRNVESLGVTFWLVKDGVTKEEVDEGIKEWRKRRGLGMNEGASNIQSEDNNL